MFIGREKELATLNGLYNSDKFEFAVIYGRRRVGKTALISHFIQDKKAIYFIGRFWGLLKEASNNLFEIITHTRKL